MNEGQFVLLLGFQYIQIICACALPIVMHVLTLQGIVLKMKDAGLILQLKNNYF